MNKYMCKRRLLSSHNRIYFGGETQKKVTSGFCEKNSAIVVREREKNSMRPKKNFFLKTGHRFFQVCAWMCLNTSLQAVRIQKHAWLEVLDWWHVMFFCNALKIKLNKRLLTMGTRVNTLFAKTRCTVLQRECRPELSSLPWGVC